MTTLLSIGPSIGPLAGAFIAQSIGWRWSFWIVLIPGALATVVMAVFSTETNHRVLIHKKITRLSKELGRTDLRSCYDDPNVPPHSATTIMLNSLVRPLKMLVFGPVLLILSLYVAFACELRPVLCRCLPVPCNKADHPRLDGVLYLLFNTIPMVFQEGYGWGIGVTGLVYIPLGLG